MALGLAEVVRRFGYARPTAATISLIEENRHRAIELALHYDEFLPDGPEKERALVLLQEAAMWANVAVTRPGVSATGDPLPDDPDFEPPPSDRIG